MPETIQMWAEISFGILYLVAMWVMVFMMYRRQSVMQPDNQRVATLGIIAFTLLVSGDTGHIVFRIVAYASGDPAPQFSFLGMVFGLRGMGTAATATTMTLFYALMVVIWRYRFDKRYGPFERLLLISALVRLVLLSFPINQWDSLVPPQPWSTIRNLPLLVQGAVAYLILREARTNKDRAFWWMGIMILVSFACYMAVVLFVQQSPLIGMLMIPKTIAYIAMCLLFYNELYKASPAKGMEVKA